MGSSLDGLLGRYEFKNKVWSVLYERSTGTYSFYHGSKNKPLKEEKSNVVGKTALTMINKIISDGYILVDDSIKYVHEQKKINKALDSIDQKELKEIDIISELEKCKGDGDE